MEDTRAREPPVSQPSQAGRSATMALAALEHLPAPHLHPEVEDIVQIDIRQQRRNDGLNAEDNFQFERTVRYRQEGKGI